MSGDEAVRPSTAPPPERRPAYASARVTGARHLREGRPCQDAVRVLAQGDIVAMAVADGHGTCAHGEIGAELAVDVTVNALLQFAEVLGGKQSGDAHAYAVHPLRLQLVREWADRVRHHAGAADADLHPYGTTLIFALATPTFLLVGQIGDGDILLVDGSGRVSRPIAPDPSSFAEETASMCEGEAWTVMRVLAIPPPKQEALLLLSTDGYGKSYATDEIFERIGPDYLNLIRESGLASLEPQLHGFLTTVTEKASGDDIALSMLYWPAARALADDTQDIDAPSEKGKDDTCENS
jgi:protein phosphatase 2C-like protein